MLEFIQKQDSLVQAVDSMKLDIAEKDKAIDSLVVVDEQLQDKLAHTKDKVIKVVQYVDSSKAVVDTYNEKELVTFFNQRYPKDTVTNPLPLAQPVLTYVAKDLVELDGAKQIITIKDSVIALTESRVNGKDSVIALFVKKENTYKNIMVNQDIQIKDWKTDLEQSMIEQSCCESFAIFTVNECIEQVIKWSYIWTRLTI